MCFSRSIPQIGQRPNSPATTSGCIGHDHTSEESDPIEDGFRKLLTADGYAISTFGDEENPNSSDYDPGPSCISNLETCAYYQALLEIDTLVISNAIDDISQDEVDLITGWLSGELGSPAALLNGQRRDEEGVR